MAKQNKTKTPEQIAAAEEKKKKAAEAKQAKADAKPVEAKENNAAAVKSLSFDEAYDLLKQGKSLKIKGHTGYFKLEEGVLKHFANNGDYLGNKTLADLQEEKEWEEK